MFLFSYFITHFFERNYLCLNWKNHHCLQVRLKNTCRELFGKIATDRWTVAPLIFAGATTLFVVFCPLNRPQNRPESKKIKYYGLFKAKNGLISPIKMPKTHLVHSSLHHHSIPDYRCRCKIPNYWCRTYWRCSCVFQRRTRLQLVGLC